MNRRKDFTAQIARLRRQILLRNLSTAFALGVAAFLTCRAGGLALEKGGWLHLDRATAFYLTAAGVALAVAALCAIRRRQRLLDFLIGLDRRLQLQERLSTAYEYRQRATASELTGLLLIDAASRLNQLDRRQVFPRKFKLSDGLLAAAVAANLALPLLPLWGTLAPREDIGPDRPLKAAQQAQTPTPDPGATARPPTGAPPTLPDAKLRALQAQPLQSTPVHPNLNRLRPSVQGGRLRSAPQGTPPMESQDQSRSVPAPVPQLKNLEVLDPGSVQPGGAAWLETSPPHTSETEGATATVFRRGEAWLESRREPPPAAGPDGQGSDTDAAAGNSADEGSASRSTGAASRRRDPPAPSAGAPDREDLPGAANTPDEGDEREAGQAGPPAGETPNPGPGHGASAERPKPPHAIDPLPGPAVQAPGGAEAAVWTRIPVRALTTAGNARVAEEDAARPYRREIESVLSKEAIPMNYRQYIRNYFLAIGLQEE